MDDSVASPLVSAAYRITSEITAGWTTDIELKFIKRNSFVLEGWTNPLIAGNPLQVYLEGPNEEYFRNKNPYRIGTTFVINLLHELRHCEQKTKLYQIPDKENIILAAYDLVIKTSPILNNATNWKTYTNNPNEVDAETKALKLAKRFIPYLFPNISAKQCKQLICNYCNDKIFFYHDDALIPPTDTEYLSFYHEAIRSGERKLKKTYHSSIDFEFDNPNNQTLCAKFLRQPNMQSLKHKIENEADGLISTKAVATIISQLQPRDFYGYGALQTGGLSNKITNPNLENPQRELDDALRRMIETHEDEFWKEWDEYGGI